MKEFEITSHIEDSGFYQVELKEYPRCTIAVTDLFVHPKMAPIDHLPSKVYDLKDGEGINYYYEIPVVDVEDEKASFEELKEAVEECWDWFLFDHLL